MPISEARKKANKKWNDEHMKERYDRIQIVVPKGKKEKIKAKADSQGKTVSGFINDAIDYFLDKD